MIKFGIVGLKNSGKTFFAQKLISYFTKKNFVVASIKHAHHNFEIDQPGTDSFLHRQAGANQVIISSSKRWAKIIELQNKREKNLNELLEELDSPDMVIVEGFKKENHPKIEIIKDPEKPSTYLFKKLKNVVALISDSKIDSSLMQFNKNEIKNIVNFIINFKS